MASLSVPIQHPPGIAAERTAPHADSGARQVTAINNGEWEGERRMGG